MFTAGPHPSFGLSGSARGVSLGQRTDCERWRWATPTAKIAEGGAPVALWRGSMIVALKRLPEAIRPDTAPS
jgi:hypothetical protein